MESTAHFQWMQCLQAVWSGGMTGQRMVSSLALILFCQTVTGMAASPAPVSAHVERGTWETPSGTVVRVAGGTLVEVSRDPKRSSLVTPAECNWEDGPFIYAWCQLVQRSEDATLRR